jgi:hypothetical protein
MRMGSPLGIIALAPADWGSRLKILDGIIAAMTPALRSFVAVIVGVAAFFAACGIMLAATLEGLEPLLTKPDNGIVIFLFYFCSGILVGVPMGSIVSGYITARIAKRTYFIHSAAVVALIAVLNRAYIMWTFDPIGLRDFYHTISVYMIVGGMPFFALGTWMGSRKRRPDIASEYTHPDRNSDHGDSL